jgi:hypothetical protein
MKALLLALSFMFVASANADLITMTPDQVKINNLKVSAGGTVSVNGVDVALETITAGLRKKYLIPFLGTDVYDATIMGNNPEAYVKSNKGNEALDSMASTQDVVVVELLFVHYVTADQIYVGFTDALKANNVDQTTAEMSQFLSDVKNGGDAQVGQTMTFMIVKNADGTETLTYENPTSQLTTVTGAAGLGKNILAMWMGNISVNDKGLQELKAQLVK